MDKAIHLSKRQYTKILGEQILLDRPLRFGILAEAATPSAQIETTEILSTQQMRQPFENSEPSVSRENRRSSKILRSKSVSGAAISPYLLLFLKDICAFVAISTFVAATCLFSQEIAPNLSELVRGWGPSV
ncbi:hypothetical protein [Agrobacterium arsenijevicii]|uniref:Uncharacterized protein n=1 Tax=Agrobacterium arsenijevicii TaxID=1585697 RepID=A0ABR5D1S2_9HYPH|nr:hypothetical protein RP75_23645 [Agrobacterium arsenijevicii]